jgi:hypothetical protein
MQALHMPDTHQIPGIEGEQTEADEVDTVIGPGLPPPLMDDLPPPLMDDIPTLVDDDGRDDAGSTIGSMPDLEPAIINVLVGELD